MSNFKYERYENEEDGGNNPTPGSQDPPPPYTVEAGKYRINQLFYRYQPLQGYRLESPLGLYY